MNKEKKTRERCRNCEHFKRIPMATNPDKFLKNCVCDLSPEMLIDIYTRRPDWCKKGKYNPPEMLDKSFVFPNTAEKTNTEFVNDILEEDSHGEVESGS